MIKIGLILLAIVILSGCATTIWVHPEYTPEKWSKDSYECERDARQSGYFGTGLSGSINFQAFYERCLRSKGWRPQKEVQQASTTAASTGITVDAKEGPPVVMKIFQNSPAYNAGIRLGDILVEKDGQKITSMNDLRSMPKIELGNPVKYKFRRGDQIFEVILIPVSASSLTK